MIAITDDLDHLMEQAQMTSADYMRRARHEIDAAFGEGYAEKNPTLVAAFMQTAASDYAAALQSKVIGEALEQVAGQLGYVAGGIGR